MLSPIFALLVAPFAEHQELRAGQLARVRSLAEIRATLDETGALDGVPFMVEMERYVGSVFRVYKRADRVCVEGTHTLRRLHKTVFLDGLRCDGADHEGCQRGCLLFWKEAWLERVNLTRDEARSGHRMARVMGSRVERPVPQAEKVAASAAGGATVYSCQSTQLARATTPIVWWDARQYTRDLWTRNLPPRELARAFSQSMKKKFEQAQRKLRGSDAPHKSGVGARPQKTPTASLGLLPGELVEVKSVAEIALTLDARNRNRGLEFAPGMEEMCGRRFVVLRKIDRVILEATGAMQPMKDTVALDGAFCNGQCARGCPRSNPLYFREIWLRRVPAI